MQHYSSIVVLTLRVVVPCRQGKHGSKYWRLQFESTARNAKQGTLNLHDVFDLLSRMRAREKMPYPKDDGFEIINIIVFKQAIGEGAGHVQSGLRHTRYPY